MIYRFRLLICKAKVLQYEKDMHTLQEALNDSKEEERKKREELKEHTVIFSFFCNIS